jgi:phosphoglycolate phosphatase
VIRLFVFDLDGTLVDSLRDLADSANELLVSYGAAPLETAAIGGMVGEGAARLVARACATVGTAPPEALERFLEIYDARLLSHTRPYDGMPEVLATLGRVASLAVLTNKPLASTRRILDGLDLAKFFDADAVIGGDGPWRRKPDTAGLLHLCAIAAAAPTGRRLVMPASASAWRGTVSVFGAFRRARLTGRSDSSTRQPICSAYDPLTVVRYDPGDVFLTRTRGRPRDGRSAVAGRAGASWVAASRR